MQFLAKRTNLSLEDYLEYDVFHDGMKFGTVFVTIDTDGAAIQFLQQPWFVTLPYLNSMEFVLDFTRAFSKHYHSDGDICSLLELGTEFPIQYAGTLMPYEA